MRIGSVRCILFAVALILCATSIANPAIAQTTNCNRPARSAIETISLPGHPFQALPAADGCWVFVSLTQSSRQTDAGIAVLQRNEGKIALRQIVETGPGSTSMALTHDGKFLIVAHDDGALFFDVARLISGHGEALLGRISDGPGSGSINVAVSADDRFLLVSDEHAKRITVIDLAKARGAGFKPEAVIGAIPTGIAPIALVFTADERYLLTTAEGADGSWGWPGVCKPEGQPSQDSGPLRSEGAVVVVDFTRAKTEPANSVLAKIPASCSPVRLALSPAGDRAYVTARNSNALLVFDTAKLLTGGDSARIANIPVGSSPVGVVVVENGAKIIVTNSNRFAGNENDHQTLTVIDSAKIALGAAAVVRSIPAGAFPRQLHATQDGRTLLLTNFNSNTLEVIDLPRVLNH